MPLICGIPLLASNTARGVRRAANVGVRPLPVQLRRTSALASVLLLLVTGAASARATAPLCSTHCVSEPPGSGPLFVVTGHGWGHGVGMSQYGAYGYAQHGWTYQQIVLHYFPGTTFGPAPLSRVRVLLADGRSSLTIASTVDFKVKDGAGVVHPLTAGSYTFGPGLKLKVGAKTQPLTAPLTFVPGAAPLQLGRLYRGSIFVDVVDGRLRAIDVVGLEQYLYGVVPAEMPYTWAPEALKAQAVVARSYALATRNVAAPYDLYPDTRSQMYLGVSAERASTNAAVDATAGQVLLYGGQVAKTFFFSTSGGRTANVGDVFGGTAMPYLVSVPDPYDTISPYHDWGPVPYTGVLLGRDFGVSGGVLDARTTRDASNRVATLALLGRSGEVDVRGTAVRSRLGLRSTWFDVGVLSLVRPPPAKPVEYGTTVPLTGVLRGVGQAALEQRPAGGAWQQVQTVAPSSTGALTLSVAPTVSSDYRLATAAAAAAPVHVVVTARVRFLPATAPNELRGTVRPVVAGAPVQIQRQATSGATWSTVARGAVDASGAFTIALTLTPGVYRARVAPGHGVGVGITPPLRVVGG
jgi:SpoIID/LytB domain protein